MKVYSFREYSQSQIKDYLDSSDIYEGYLSFLKKKPNYKAVVIGGKLYKERTDTRKRILIECKKEEINLIKDKINQEHNSYKNTMSDFENRLSIRAKYHKFERINRVPDLLVSICEIINKLGLDDKVIIIGTNIREQVRGFYRSTTSCN